MFFPFVLLGILLILSVVWIVFSGNYFFSSVNVSGVVNILPSDMAYMIFSVAIPVLILLVIGLIFYQIYEAVQTKSMILSLSKISKSQSSMIQTVGKSLIEVRKLGFTNQFFLNLPIILNDMSIFVSNIITMLRIESNLVVDSALSKPSDLRLSAVCRILLDKREKTPHFDETLRRIIRQNDLLQAQISLFEERYNMLISSLNEYDIDKFTLKTFEEGDLGRFYNVIVNAKSFDSSAREDTYSSLNS